MSIRRIRSIVSLCVSALLLFTLADLFSQNPAPFQSILLSAEGNLCFCDRVDVNNDGRLDVVLFCAKAGSPPQKQILAYLQDDTGGFSPDRKQTLALPADVSAAHLVTLNNTLQIACIDASGMTLRPWGEKGEPKRVIEAASFFQYATDMLVPWREFADYNGDKQIDCLFPLATGYQLFYQQSGGSFTGGPVLEGLPLRRLWESSTEGLYYDSVLPTLQHIDANCDGRKDFATVNEKGAFVFLQTSDGKYALAPGLSVAELDPAKKDEIQLTAFQLFDCNCDGLADLVGAQTFGSIGLMESLRTKLKLRMGRKEQIPFGQEYDQLLLIKGVSIVPAALDFNRDGYVDLLTSAVRTDVLAAVGALMNDEVTLSYNVYLFDPKANCYSATPVLDWDVDADLGKVARKKTLPTLVIDHDLNGDGVYDLAQRTEDGAVLIYTGKMGDDGFPAFAPKNADRYEITFKDPGNRDMDKIFFSVHPLNHDKIDDIVITNFQDHVVQLLLSEGK